uniref:BHLH domain-containing protein n=1 Tax=Fundulus heteroclitus TaxID=8078 RepID=A0A3Q2QYF1_FUNHE
MRYELRSEEVLSKSDASGEQQERFGEMSGCSLGDAFYSGCSAMDQLGTFMRNVQVLLEAASYIESAEKSSGKCEHGYASAYPETQMAHQHKHRKFKSRKVDNMHNRNYLNDVSSHRRAHLRLCLERLKSLIPLGPDCRAQINCCWTSLNLLKSKSRFNHFEKISITLHLSWAFSAS